METPNDNRPDRGLLGSRFVQRDLGSTFVTAVDIALMLALVIMVNLAVSRAGCSFNKRSDWTAWSARKKVYALSEKTVKFLKDLKKPVQVIVFVAPPGGNSEFMFEDIKELLTRMHSESRFVSVEYVNLDTQQQRAVEIIKKHKLNLDRDAFASTNLGDAVGGQVIFVSDQRVKNVNFFDTVKYKDNTEDQRNPQKKPDPRIQAFKGEELFLNALITVTQQRQPRVCFTKGHGEAAAEGFGASDLGFASEELKRQNFATETVDKISGQVPVRCDVLVVAGPKLPLQESEVSAVQAYLAKGGKLVLGLRMLDLEGKTWSRTGLEDLTERHGVKLEDAYAVDAGKLLQPHPVLGDITIKNYAFAADDGWDSKHPIGRAMTGKPLRVDAPRALTVATKPGFETSAVLSTGSGKDAWGERDLYANRVGYDEKKDVKGPVPLIVASKETKKNGARVVVLGSWLLMANYKLDPNQQAIDYTKELILNIFNWVTEQEMLVALAPRRPEHIKLALTEKQVASAGRTVILFLPLIAVCLALIAWMAPTVSQRRSRRASDAAGRKGAGPEGGAR